jgi:hypothetical protein
MVKNNKGNGQQEIQLSEVDKKAKEEEEKTKRAKRKALESLPSYFHAMFGKEGTDLLEVGVITERQKLLYAVQIMQESIPVRGRKRLSTILREAELHGSIGVGGKGRDDLHKLDEREMKSKMGVGSEAIDRGY